MRLSVFTCVLSVVVLTLSKQENREVPEPNGETFGSRLRECDQLAYVAPDTAIARLNDLLAADPALPAPLVARVRLARGEALMRSARHGEALLEFEALQREEGIEPWLRTRIELRLAAALVMQARIAEAEPHIAAAAEWIAGNGGDLDRGLLASTRGVVLQTDGRFEEALALFQEAQALFVQAKAEPQLQTLALYNAATAMMALGDKPQALQTLLAAQELSPGGHQLAMILGARAGLATTNDERRGLFDEALLIERQIGSRSGEALFLRRLGQLDVSDGRMAEAGARFEASLAITRTLGNEEAIASSLIDLANITSARGEHERALELGEEALQRATHLGMPVVEVLVTESFSRILAAAGQTSRALDVYRSFHAASNRLAENSRSLELQRARSRHEADLARQAHAAELEVEVLWRNVALGGAAAAATVAFVLARLLRQKASIVRDVVRQNAEIRTAHEQMSDLAARLGTAMEDVKRLSGLLPICAHCKAIRDQSGSWRHLEEYVSTHSEASFSHGICPTCAATHYAER